MLILKIILIFILVCLTLFALMLVKSSFECDSFVVTRYTVKTDKDIKSPLKIVAFADLHNVVFGEDNSDLLKAVEGESPDLIILAGDMITLNEAENNLKTAATIEKLSQIAPVYYGIGNHEMRYRDLGKYMNIAGERVHFLRDEKLEKADTGLVLYGLDLDRSYYTRFHSKPLSAEELAGRLGFKESEKYNILIAHNPEYFDAYAGWGADLVLSGHIHGGIVRLPGLGGMISPRLKPFPKYDYGRYEKGRTVMLLTNGLGTHLIPLRVFNKPEIMSITLLKN
ncbi:MAG: metallophosphoesterase [Lachnospiraceae bacterium]|nr:metallophosphoesterase [Lachnospiraceae bacterium]